MLRPSLFETKKPDFFDNALDRMFDNAFTDFWGNGMNRLEGFNTDVIDKGDHYLLQAELPGFQKEDINIDLAEDTLVISANHSEESEENDDKKHHFIRRERHYSSYRRSFYIQGITEAEIDASYKNGILEVTFPKNEIATAQAPKKIEIK